MRAVSILLLLVFIASGALAGGAGANLCVESDGAIHLATPRNSCCGDNHDGAQGPAAVARWTSPIDADCVCLEIPLLLSERVLRRIAPTSGGERDLNPALTRGPCPAFALVLTDARAALPAPGAAIRLTRFPTAGIVLRI